MHAHALSHADHDQLEAYFTDVEYLRDLFATLVGAASLPKRLLIIHGVGGVGKSSLLRMFRLHCTTVKVPLALASGDEAKSAVDLLSAWAADLQAQGIKLPTFTKTVEHYRAVQAKVEEQVRTAQEARNNAAGTLGKGAARTAIEVAASLIPIPGLGPLVTAVGGMSSDALIDWLSSFLKKPDIDLLLDPSAALTNDYLRDITPIAAKRRIVLLLDTFEQMTTLTDWVCDLARRLHPNLLLVIAGRIVPNWHRQWPSWLAQANIEELKPMSPDVIRELISRYYATMRGGTPEPAQVEAIIAFSRGLPVVVTSAVRLWVQYGVEDFQMVKPQVVADLVDRLLEGVPAELVPILEAAAALRWFNKDILRAVTGLADVNVAYDELRRFPFTRPRVEGFALHTAVREIIDEHLRVHDPARHREVHERALTYFAAQTQPAIGPEAEKAELEQLYHRVHIDEDAGIRLFQEMAESLVNNRLINRARTLLSDVASYTLRQWNSQRWRDYYQARLETMEKYYVYVESLYQEIADDERLDPKLRAYACCDWGGMLIRVSRLREPGGVERARTVIERSLTYPIDAKLIWNYSNLGGMYVRLGADDQALANYEIIKQYFVERQDRSTTARIWSRIMGVYVYQGHWNKVFEAYQEGIKLLAGSAEQSYAKSSLLSWAVAWVWAGRYAEAERHMVEQAEIDQHLGLPASPRLYRYRGFVLGMQGRFAEAISCLDQAMHAGDDVYNTMAEAVNLVFLGAVQIKAGHLAAAKQSLQRSLEIKRRLRAERDIPEPLMLLGQLYEVYARTDPLQRSHALDEAGRYYAACLELQHTNRNNLECAALLGLLRVRHAQGDLATIPQVRAQAETLAHRYEYNDYRAALRLSQGHLAWDIAGKSEQLRFNAVLRFYQQALIYALRYNRFLLDEVLSGGGVGTPLQPIVAQCQQRGAAGRQMLSALCDWWQSGVNDISGASADTIVPLPAGIPLLEAERIAREREPGDGAPQQTLIVQIEQYLKAQSAV